MDTSKLLESLLNASQQASKKGKALAEETLGVPGAGSERDAMLDGMGKGALAAGAVALLLGSKSGRKLTKSAVKLGGIAAIGGLATGTPIDKLDARRSDQRSETIIQAMIAAAKADGHIDDTERAAIEAQINNLQLEKDFTSFLLRELDNPVDVSGIAKLADSPEAAAEIYLASAMVIDDQNAPERQYLDSLAKALQLDPALTADLERQLTQFS